MQAVVRFVVVVLLAVGVVILDGCELVRVASVSGFRRQVSEALKIQPVELPPADVRYGRAGADRIVRGPSGRHFPVVIVCHDSCVATCGTCHAPGVGENPSLLRAP